MCDLRGLLNSMIYANYELSVVYLYRYSDGDIGALIVYMIIFNACRFDRVLRKLGSQQYNPFGFSFVKLRNQKSVFAFAPSNVFSTIFFSNWTSKNPHGLSSKKNKGVPSNRPNKNEFMLQETFLQWPV